MVNDIENTPLRSRMKYAMDFTWYPPSLLEFLPDENSATALIEMFYLILVWLHHVFRKKSSLHEYAQIVNYFINSWHKLRLEDMGLKIYIWNIHIG